MISNLRRLTNFSWIGLSATSFSSVPISRAFFVITRALVLTLILSNLSLAAQQPSDGPTQEHALSETISINSVLLADDLKPGHQI